MKQLTKKQEEILDEFVKYSVTNYNAPTLEYLSGIIGITKRSAHDRMRACVRKGYLLSHNSRPYEMTQKCRERYGVMTFHQIRALISELKSLMGRGDK